MEPKMESSGEPKEEKEEIVHPQGLPEQNQVEQTPSEEDKPEEKNRKLLWVIVAVVTILLILVAVLVALGMKREAPMEGEVMDEQGFFESMPEFIPFMGEEPSMDEEPMDVPEPAPAPAAEMSGCDLDGKNYSHGEVTVSKSGCEDCVCDNGAWDCKDNGACTNPPPPTPQPSGQPGDCDFQGATYRDGETRKADCDHICTCKKGNWDCVMQPTSKCCQYGGKLRKNGESFPAGDGCNTCTCSNGGVNCTMMLCTP